MSELPGDEPVTGPSDPGNTGPDVAEESEADLDEALEESFPASDPPSTWAGPG